jgi:hypothetical protein
VSRLSLTFVALLGLTGATVSQAQDIAGGDLPPPGYGTLSQDDISIRLAAVDIEIRIVPLDQRLLRLLANDAYASLNKLQLDRKPQIDSVASLGGASDPGLALVSFFGLRDGVRFEPLNVYVVIRNQSLQPLGMVPLTATLTNRQLDARQQASAILVYRSPIPVYESFGVAYGNIAAPDAWRNVLERVKREQSRVMAKVRQGQVDSATGP